MKLLGGLLDSTDNRVIDYLMINRFIISIMEIKEAGERMGSERGKEQTLREGEGLG